MEILTQTELRMRIEEILEKIEQGAIFIYPTDTIYGIGCIASNQESVKKIRELKEGRPTAPFSIWVPSLQWVKKNCKITKEAEKWLAQLPGPLTLILELNESESVAKNIAPEVKTIGIRYPNHWFGRVVDMLGKPIVTTSANKTGEPFMTSVENLDPDVQKGVSFMIYEGTKEGRPSKIVNVGKKEIKNR